MQRLARTAPIVAPAILLALSAGACMAAEVETLYGAKTIVTGQSEPNRLRGFAVCPTSIDAD